MTPLELLGGAQVATLVAAVGVLLANRLRAPRIRSGVHLTDPVRSVSVLVPVRDEMENLPSLLDAWRRVEHPDWEMLVLDDGSVDGSLAYLRERAREFPRLRVVQGLPLPPGWRGKNWACQQLWEQADGDLVLFCDADVVVAPQALVATVALLEKERAGLVSGFGRQESIHPLVGSVVSLVVDLPLRAFLPLRLAADRPEPSLAAAVGQWMMYTRDAYRTIGGHRAVANLVSEDLALARKAKRAGVKVVAALAEDVLSVRMYRTTAQVWTGFVKNFADLGGGGAGGWVAAMAFAMWFYVLPVAIFAVGSGVLSVAPIVLLAILVASASPGMRTGLRNLAWFPIGAPFLVGIGLRSALNPFWPVAWKGRVL
ncbi:MAG: glycosyltransferase [Fibrobacterota bacterium]|nr:MAG: glycosyltransferase [Fibrobacterota bacterium]